MSWGDGSWGAAPWGGGAGGDLELLAARAVRENCVRLSFSTAVFLTNDLSPRDGAHLRKYSLANDVTSTGLDGKPARAVRAAKVELAKVTGAGGALVDVWVDRPLSPYPSLYTVSVVELYGASGELLAPGFTTTTFFGVQAALVRPSLNRPGIARDFANPQFPGTLSQVGAPSNAALGAFTADSSGDYATDDGLTSYKKRVLRRLLTRKGAFAHLPDYGVSVPAHVKELAKPSTRASFTAEAESQISQEPETERVQVQLVPLGEGAFKLGVKAKVRFRAEPVEFEHFVTGGG